MDGSNFNSRSRKSQWSKWSVSGNDENGDFSDNHKKKMMHREIEKQRRKEMSALHSSLRSLLPLEYIKGKRSMSDHMNEAVNYVRDLKNNIKELSAKKDELKKLSDSSGSGSSSNDYSPSRVMIHPCLGGLEVVISSSLTEESFPTSKVLEVLLREGHDVVSCASTKVNTMLLLITFHTQVNDPTCIDISGLQEKLNEVIP